MADSRRKRLRAAVRLPDGSYVSAATAYSTLAVDSALVSPYAFPAPGSAPSEAPAIGGSRFEQDLADVDFFGQATPVGIRSSSRARVLIVGPPQSGKKSLVRALLALGPVAPCPLDVHLAWQLPLPAADTPRRPFDFVVILVDWTNLASFNQARLALSGVSSNLAHLSHHRNPEAFDGAAFQLGGLHPETLSSGRACVVCTHVDKRSKSALSAADLSSLTERFLVPVLSANLTSPHSSISTALRISRMAAQASSAAPLPQPAGMTASSAGSLGASGAAPYTRGGSLGLTLEHVLIPRTIHQQPVAMAAPPRQAENPAQPPPAGPESQARR